MGIMHGIPPVLLIVVVICATIIILRLLSLKKEAPAQDPEEIRLVRSMQETLDKLEQRVRTLETLLDERQRRENMAGT